MSQQITKQEIEALEKEEDDTWWRAGERDNFDLNKKLLRVGCRPIYRKLILCQKEQAGNNQNCTQHKQEVDKCLQMLKFVYATQKN
ncbi:hypothetical protein TTHERM_00460450 (macronuclear) [Tetrahymena thermophila SB210]|uniref:Uncharacterized protein n=1 Tax=Tetrahymena thermophila (strain SB210) TaxID=312017 RepID=Q23Q39_TETTS|nr:hypothetical protein TTHERM_00460450 [Tetrahymena thermophila SB210]EAR98496.1 hypothetical protein TTHERM_00460450 [Tetrahymena thermophila SB210]|eukprot:XP_001018741.1 hypothetical protein TTHERM_00460450 [Tetrahymena thermophila SB210]